MLLVGLLAGACGDDSPSRGAAVIGPEGGTVVGIDGAEIVIPPGALSTPVEIAIARSSEDAPALTGDRPLGEVYEITPHGQAFALPATVRVPYDLAAVDAAQELVLMKGSADGQWRRLEGPAIADGFASVTVSELSWFQVRQGPSLWLPDPPPMTTHVNISDLGGFVRFTATGVTPTLTILQQPDALTPARFEADLYIASDWDVAPWGDLRLEVSSKPAALYHLNSEAPAGVNRVYYDEGALGASLYSSPIPRDTAVRTTYEVNSRDATWRGFSYITQDFATCQYDCPALPPTGAEFDSPALVIRLAVMRGRTEVTSKRYVVTPGFENDRPLFFTQPPATLRLLEGEEYDGSSRVVPYHVDGPPDITTSWQRQNAAGSWDDLPEDSEGAVGLRQNTWGLSSALVADGRVSDSGAKLRVLACVTATEVCVASNVVNYEVTRNFPQPVFTTQPTGRRYNVGQMVDVNVAFEGFPLPQVVRWQQRRADSEPWIDADPARFQSAQVGTASDRGTSRLIGLVPLTLAERGLQLRATYTTVAGTATSSAAIIDVTTGQAPPVITTQPLDVTIGAGLPVVLATTVTGAVPLSFQWYKDGVRLAGRNGPLLVLNGVTAADAGVYRLDVSNVEDTVHSNDARVTVTGAPATLPPTITQQPRGFAALAGSGITLVVAATGGAPLTYQWRKDGTPVAGATGAMLPLVALTTTDAGAYSVTVTNGGGAVTSTDAIVTILRPLQPATMAPVITVQPAPITALEGDTATFAAEVTGDPAPSCQWTRNGVPIPLATSCAGYTTPALAVADDGVTYNLAAFNPAGTVFGDGAIATVEARQVPVIVTQPADQSVIEGSLASFHVTATANGPLTFQWRRDGVDVSGATDNLYVLPTTTLADDGARFSARVCNGPPTLDRCVVSRAARLGVGPVLPANALTALQVVAAHNASVVLRPDRTVWAWGERYQADGTMSNSIPPGQEAYRPVRIFPTALTDVYQLAGWYDSYWALVGTPGSVGSRVLHWGAARAGDDGRGTDGAGGSAGTVPGIRYNHAAPVVVLERIAGTPTPVDRVCAISGGGMTLVLIRAIAADGSTTSCAPTAEKTVWYAGTITPYTADSLGVVLPLPGLPTDAPATAVFHGQTYSGTPPLLIALADGRLYGHGENPYNGLGLPVPAPAWVGGAGGPIQLPAAWGDARRFAMTFYYSLFVVHADGTVLTSGYDANDELGLGDLAQGSRVDGPTAVLAETCAALPCADVLTGVTDLVSNSGLATIAIKDGALLGWGSTATGLLGPGFPPGATQGFPRPIPSTVTGFTALSSASAHALALGPGGAVYAWGSNSGGALGDGYVVSSRTAPGLVTTP